MRTLVIMHAESEGPGTFGEFLHRAGATVKTARLNAGDRLPDDPRKWDAVVSMGGPMNVYEEDRYPFLRDETEFLADAVAADVPTLGICLGAQMIAKACGAGIHASPAKEVGWSTVSLTEAGVRDVLFRGLPQTLPVLQWHEDAFELPEGSCLLAMSEVCPNQAFRYRNAYGLQFHIEVTRQMLAEWFEGTSMRDEILRQFDASEKQLARHAADFYSGFVSLINYRGAASR